MQFLAGLFTVGAMFLCCGVLLIALIVGGVLFYTSRQRAQSVSPAAPTPPIQATIEHPTAAPQQAAAPPVAIPAGPPAPPAAPAAPAPPPVAPEEPGTLDPPAEPGGQQPDA
jgi:hypothetical protein